jgi:hypothetical protein
MHPPLYYRKRAGQARRLASIVRQSEIEDALRRMAEDFDDIACDLENGAVDFRHPELMPQLSKGQC